jgi:chromosome segregation ATPase
MDTRMTEVEQQHDVTITKLKDLEDDMQIVKNDVDIAKIQLSSVERDICLLDSSMENAHNQLEDLGGQVDGFVETARRISHLSETNSKLLGMEIQWVQRETCSHVEGFFQKFERVNDVINKKFVQLDTELEKVVSPLRRSWNMPAWRLPTSWVLWSSCRVGLESWSMR